MIQTLTLAPGVTLRCCQDPRFHQNCLSLQFLRPMDPSEASLNALLPAVLLRGCKAYPDLRAITNRLDDLYGAGVGALVRRIGDCQTTGLSCGFINDRFALSGDRIFTPVMELLGQLLLEPLTENGGFCREYVESEKKNLISTIEAERNDKRTYANSQLLRSMCKSDSFGTPRLGTAEAVAAIDPETLYAHYRKLLQESPVDIFYAGGEAPETVALGLSSLFDRDRQRYVNRPVQTPFADHRKEAQELVEEMEVSQAKLCMGFTTPITNRHPDFAAMQVFNALFGGDQTSKLFMTVREKMSLCYSIGSGYYSTKGILVVSAGIDSQKKEQTQSQVMSLLDDCCQAKITEAELRAAKAAVISSLRTVHDSPGAIEGYYATAALSGLSMAPPEYIRAVEAVTVEQAAAAARTLTLHTTYVLKEAAPC